ncbi:hypothetical protein PVAP13_1NG069000 [Panicum virgatum]|uniref:Uncharacterized protein n=1 Tax=Panicum virgatum TaxID=38727 RepID=A0A8T0WLE6_PANVG|nr:hypothetical protein PVAP13_1NG069000 [Panicum virgatum]
MDHQDNNAKEATIAQEKFLMVHLKSSNLEAHRTMTMFISFRS